jgi:hypothetical protein
MGGGKRTAHVRILVFFSTAWVALPEPSVHALAVYGYTSDDWRIDMVVLPGGLVKVDGVLLQEDTFDVELKTRSPPPYILWNGKYAPDTGVTEDGYVNRERRVEAIPPENALDLAFRLIVQEHSEVDLSGQAWSEVDADEGAWSSRYRYESGGWRVTVQWYESLKHYVKIEWTVRVSADGERVEEQSFNSFYG